MTKRSFQVQTWTPTAVADTTNLVNANHMSIGATAAANGLTVLELYIGGQATASSINLMVFARNSTIGASPAALAAPNTDGSLDTRTAATQSQLGSQTYTNATTAPQRSVAITAARLNLSLNTFGGIVRWVAAPGEEWGITGVTVNVSESSLSAFTGGSPGALGAHIIYEPM